MWITGAGMSGSGQSGKMSRLGLWTLIVGVGFLIGSFPLQYVINMLVDLDVSGSMVLATVVWVVWIVWLVAAVVLFIIWLAKQVLKSRRG